MKRILTTVAALSAVLAFGTVAHATLYTYNVQGTDPNTDANSVDTVSSFANNPPGYFIGPLSAGSNVQVDITGNVVTLNSATFNVNLTTSVGFLGTITSNVVATYAGGTGTLSGNQVLWNTPTTAGATGTFFCDGSICDLFQLTPDTPYPIALLTQLTGGTPVLSVDLGRWILSADLGTIVSSTPEVIVLGGAAPPPGPGLPAQWYQLGSRLPEPGTFALVLLGLGGLALRSRKA
ncbi:MAG TPA: PEP-CTERM sorting domain-containing protein [Myxococcota bacterium]|nr:PEP-CTERM sorting domain-containing protein [Myxococcota bacterium]